MDGIELIVGMIVIFMLTIGGIKDLKEKNYQQGAINALGITAIFMITVMISLYRHLY